LSGAVGGLGRARMVLVGVGVVERPGGSRNTKMGDPGWAQNGGSQNCTPQFFGFGVTCPWAQNGGCNLYPPRWAHVGSIAHCSFGLERVSGDGEWVERLPRGWGWAMAAMVVQRGGWGMAPLLPVGWGLAMAPLFGQGWDREGWAFARYVLNVGSCPRTYW